MRLGRERQGSHMIAFGPVPSRRLGQSLGVNHLPHKVCSYSCTYCQVGPTLQMRVERHAFLPTAEIVAAVRHRVDECRAAGETIDYISFVPDGEPTLDLGLGDHIRAVADIGIPVAVFTNASLLWMPEVRRDLAATRLVSVKVDTTRPDTWRRLDRPHGALELPLVLDGIRTFAREFPHELISETMLVRGVNDAAECIEAVTDFLEEIAPARAYLGIPTRPPANPDVQPPHDVALVRAHEIMKARLPHVELLHGHEDGAFTPSGEPAEGLPGILAVHPMREAAVRKYLERSGADWSVVEQLTHDGRVARVEYRGETFFVRRSPRHCNAGNGHE